MNENVSVDQAISKGHRMVTYPGILIMLFLLGLTIYLGSKNLFPGWFWAIAFVLSFATPWLYWSIMISKWRLWAFEHVRNVHELKKRAILEKLIWDERSFFGRTEIRSAGDKEKWAVLLQKFEREDEFQEDFSISNETIIYFSKGSSLLNMAIFLACLGFGLYTILEEQGYLLGGFFTVFGAIFSYKAFRQTRNREPQVIINEKGLKTVSTPFYEWKDIENEEVVRKGSGKHTHYYLSYTCPKGTENLKIDDLDANYKKIMKLLILYRGRYTKKNLQW